MTAPSVGWRVARLGDVAETALGKMLDAARPRGASRVPYLRNLNVQWGRIDLDDVQDVLLNEEEKQRFALAPGDLLVCEGGEIGRAAIWRGGAQYMAYQKALHRIRSRGGLDLAFLRYLLEHYASKGELRRRATGSTILHLPQRQLRELPIPLPPLAEQRRIVEILEDHLSRLDAADSNAHRAEAQLAALDGAWICRHPILSSAPRRRLGELLAEPLSNGRSVPDGDGFPVLRLTCLRDGQVDLAQRKRGRWSAADAARYLVAPGDFLVARGNGSLRLVGVGALVDEPRVDPVAYPDTLIRVRPQPQLLEPHLLAIVWNSAIVRRQLEGMARTTAGIYKVNQRHLESVELPVPALTAQHGIVGDAQQQRYATQRLRRATRGVVEQSIGLRSALLTAAFTGQLTGRAPDDEVVQELAGV